MIIADLAPDAPLVTDLAGASASGDDLSLDTAVLATIVNGTLALNLDQSDTFKVVLTSNVTSLVMTGWPSTARSKRVAIYFVQDQVGGRLVNWPANIKWSRGIPHGLSVQPGAIDCFVFGSFDGGQTVFGNVVGLGYA